LKRHLVNLLFKPFTYPPFFSNVKPLLSPFSNVSFQKLLKKYWTHHGRFSQNDASNCFHANFLLKNQGIPYAFIASSIATAQATVIPTMGLLPISVVWKFGLKNREFIPLKLRIYILFLSNSYFCGRIVDENLSTQQD